MIGSLIQANLLQDYQTKFIKVPITRGYGGMGLLLKLVRSMLAIKNASTDNNISAGQKLGNSLLLAGYGVAVIPILLTSSNGQSMLKVVMTYLNSKFRKWHTGLMTFLMGVIAKISNNFMLSAIFIPITGLISTILLLLGSNIGKIGAAVSKFSKISILPEDILYKYKNVTRYIGIAITTEFPQIHKFFAYLNSIYQKLKSTMSGISSKIKSGLEDKTLNESIGVGKMITGGLAIGLLIMLFKKTKIGALFAVAIGIVAGKSQKVMNALRRMPAVYAIFKAFKKYGNAIVTKLGIMKFLTKITEYIKNLKMLQVMYSSFTSA